MTRPLIFVSYSHQNERERQQLVTQLGVLESDGQIALWSDERIGAGRDWQSEIDAALSAARVGVLLVTAEFLTSKFILQAEVPRLLDAHVSRGLSVFPIVAKPCAWEAVSWLRKMQLRPRNGKAVWRDGGRHAEKELAAIVNELAGVLRTEPKPQNVRPMTMPSLMERAGSRERFAGLPCSDECRAAIAEIESATMVLYGRRSVDAAAQLLKLAIEYGAPLYNNRRITDCAHIYATTAMLLEAIVRPGDGMQEAGEPVEHPLLLAHLASLTASAVSVAGGLTRTDADAVAWSLRYSFDEILLVDRAVDRVRNGLDRIGRTEGARAEAAAGTMLGMVIDVVSGLEQEGVIRGRDWVLTCATMYRYATDVLLEAVRRIPSPRVSQVVQVLRAVGAEAQNVADNPYRVAWRLQHAFASTSRTLTQVS